MEMRSRNSTASNLIVVVIAVIVLGFAGFVAAYDFYVGGRDGWVERPRESYNQWAGRNRFQVGDTLIFRYQRGNDSVLQVTQIAYDACNTTNPLLTMNDGDSVFRFTTWGPFYFISGAPGHCANGQKLIVVVISPFHFINPPSPAPGPAVSAPTPVSPPAPEPSAGA